MILPFLDTIPNRSYPLAEASWAFMRRAFCLEANLNVKREMSESFGKLSAERQAQAVRSVRFYYYDLVAKQPREPGTAGWQPAAREEVGQYSPPARSTQGHSRNADERETPEGARRGPEGTKPAKPSSSDRRGVGRTEEAHRGGRLSATGNPSIAATSQMCASSSAKAKSGN